MNLKKNKTLVTVIVLLVVLGLVAAYIPFLFPQSVEVPHPPLVSGDSGAASLLSPNEEGAREEAPKVLSSEETEEPASEEVVPDSFGGLEEETESLDELNDLLEGL